MCVHANPQVCVCVCASRGVSASRDLRSHATFQHLAADCRAAANKWARRAGGPPPKPAEREIIILDHGLKPSLLFSSPA